MINSIFFNLSNDSTENILLNLLIFLLIIVVLVSAYVLYVAQKSLKHDYTKKLAELSPEEQQASRWSLSKFMSNIGLYSKRRSEIPVSEQKRVMVGQAIVLEDESDVMMDHEYDGIRELDNDLPPWWKYGFYASILFAVIYLAKFHVFSDGQVMANEYAEQMAEAAAQKEAYLAKAKNLVDENNVVVLDEASDLAEGKSIYTTNCTVCHLDNGAGIVGPNLTDEYWLHGGGIKNVFKTIKYGVPAKGMISWQDQLTPLQMQQVASYILGFQGTNPEGGKAPEGEKWVESEAPAPAEPSDTESAE